MLVVATSLGQIIVLSVNVLEEIGVTTNAAGNAVTGSDGAEGDEEEGEWCDAVFSINGAVLITMYWVWDSETRPRFSL